MHALDVNRPKLQHLAVELQTSNPEQAALLRGVVEQLDREYKDSRAVLQRQTDFFRLDQEGDGMDQDIDKQDESRPPVPPVPPANGAGSVRPSSDANNKPPAAKNLCDGVAPMEGQEGDAQLQFRAAQLYEKAREANLQVDVDLDLLDLKQLRAWAVANGLASRQ